MAHPDVTKEVFLWGMSVIYLFAFASLYYQIPGLYGDKGILPIKPELKYECKDGSEHCSSWAGRGECDRNPDYMLKQCQKSCKVCTASRARRLRLSCGGGLASRRGVLASCASTSSLSSRTSHLSVAASHLSCGASASRRGVSPSRRRVSPLVAASRLSSRRLVRGVLTCVSRPPLHDDVSRSDNMLPTEADVAVVAADGGARMRLTAWSLLALCASSSLSVGWSVSKAMRSADSFLLLWGLYFSCYQVGQTFMWFQWDILLLEAGFITILVAPFNLVKFGRWATRSRYHDNITLWLVRWLLFRLMFASGVVKLQSQCPTWWGLTAMEYQLRVSVAITTPPLYSVRVTPHSYSPPNGFRSLSTVIVYQFPHGGNLLTGNYNFFNLLTIVLCVTSLEDFFFTVVDLQVNNTGSHCLINTWVNNTGYEMVRFVPASLRELVALMLEAAFAGSLLFYAHKLFSLSLDTTRWKVDSKVVFTPQQLDWFVRQVLPLSIIMGAASLSLEVCDTIVKSLKYERKLMRRLWALLGTIVFSAAAFSMFSISLVSLTTLDDAVQKRLPQPVMYLYGKQRPFTLTSSYGLFRRMTGVGGRPELILEASNNLERGWKEYSFLYKPGNISTAPPVVFPHQPRLDWQMWFAALGHHERNPWFLSLVQRLLEGEPTVLQLMGPQPFKKAPKYIRASVYHYHYTTAKKGTSTSKNWWWREKKREYLPAVTLDSKLMLTHAKTAGLQEERSRTANVLIKQALDYLRFHVNQLTASALVWALFLSTVVVMLVRPGRRL
ncbi:PREDICTED: LOW QUALITY PROTEIN: lipase maturation factor 2-like [Priapulus caudatus]|uniref:Lipase maturation factor n=1 Tax=Priapulus caudatus TaxID=37621 RepID=A0ABM1ES08_PRICU|nr:PREDICTED: LOW QUALITY PROTEIN: lipase maturation factor 2-like [Priapulus caudatus]